MEATQPITLCQRCSAANPPTASLCGRCGAPVQPSATAPPVQTVGPLLTCAVCGSTAVYRLSGVVQGASWSGAAQGLTVGGVGDHAMLGLTGLDLSGSTHLASALAPPPRPCPSVNLLPFVAGGLALCCAIVGAAGWLLRVPGDPTGPALAVVGVAGAIAGAVGLRISLSWPGLAASRFAAQDALWQRRLSVWSRLFYCPRCDHVTDPLTRRYAPSGQHSDLLGG